MCTSVEPFTGSWATYQGPHPWRKLTHLSTSTSTSSSSFLSRSGALWDFSHKWWGFEWLDLVNILYRQQQSLRSCVQRPAISRKESFSVVLWNLWFLSLPNNTPWHLGKGTMINISHSWISNSYSLIFCTLTRSESLSVPIHCVLESLLLWLNTTVKQLKETG